MFRERLPMVLTRRRYRKRALDRAAHVQSVAAASVRAGRIVSLLKRVPIFGRRSIFACPPDGSLFLLCGQQQRIDIRGNAVAGSVCRPAANLA